MTIENLIYTGYVLLDITNPGNLENEYEIWCSNVKTFFRQHEYSKEIMAEAKINMHYQTNEYSADDTRRSIIAALKKTLLFLENLHMGFTESECMPTDLALKLIEKILDNFFLYYRTMYHSPVHKRGTLTQEMLKLINIGNEYDLQRMLYALLLPLFPTTRQEVVSDNGYGGMRADIYLEEYKLIIETKCTRESMTEKKLLDELGADAFLYQADTVFFFVYDPKGIVKNPELLKKTFSREIEKSEKRIELFILQPMVI